ncbi:hypothetical protein RJ639_037310 [Escallonia herrerae]|uniref:Beta-glucosidase n=1 Tax=Escallonia herrerae TaxID=1293975 RepID=A0AA88WUL5_9ASTE|nr:hypothetical protein RJ639_037310 [Escallonia herrerae]
MTKIGLDAYRFSISWPRILPGGKLRAGVNPEGIKYYNDVIDELLAKGVDKANDYNLTICGARNDAMRIQGILDHLFYLRKAIDDGANVGGYFIWSLLDNFEWNDGYNVRFGIIYEDYKNDCTRYPKKSAIWLMNFLRKGYSPNHQTRDCLSDDENLETPKKSNK